MMTDRELKEFYAGLALAGILAKTTLETENKIKLAIKMAAELADKIRQDEAFKDAMFSKKPASAPEFLDGI